MNLTRLKYFVAVTQHGSINKAAQALNISQPALTRHLKILEEELEEKLFIRTTQGVIPTEIGNILLGHSKNLVAELSRLQESLTTARSLIYGSVRVGLIPSVSFWLTPMLLRQSRKLYPSVSLHITESPGEVLRQWTATGRLDIAITQEFEEDAGLRQKLESEESIVVVGHRQLLEKFTNSIKWSDTAQMPLVMTTGMSRFITQWAEEQYVNLKIHHSIDSIVGVLQILLAGEFCSILPSSIGHQTIIGSGLRCIPLEDPPITRRLVSVRSESLVATSSSIAIEGLIGSLLSETLSTLEVEAA